MTYGLEIKKFFAALFQLLGAFNLLRIQKQKQKAFVLMYHRILGAREREAIFVQPGMYVNSDTFLRQVAYLKERFDILPLEELVARIETGRNVGGCCAITFDDGWHDNYTQAFPVLLKFQIPATIFLATGFIGTGRLFWPEEVSYYLQEPRLRSLALEKSETLARFLREMAGKGGVEEFLENCIVALKAQAPEDREEILAELRAVCSAPVPERLLINWEEAKEMQASGLIDFGAHTANHVILDQVPLEQAEDEIVKSRQELENRLGVPPVFFAYPNGSYNNELKELLKKHGFIGAVTTRKGWLGKGLDLFEISRIGIHEDISNTIPLFLARILLRRF